MIPINISLPEIGHFYSNLTSDFGILLIERVLGLGSFVKFFSVFVLFGLSLIGCLAASLVDLEEVLFWI